MLNEDRKNITSKWFKLLRDKICASYLELENNFAQKNNLQPQQFHVKKWDREGGGGGEMSVMRNGNVFEKVGVNISTVYGKLDESFAKEIPGALEDKSFFATGISIVSHPKSPLVPAAHFNTRYICTQKDWFGGGGDLTPTFLDNLETDFFHEVFKDACDKFDHEYYPKFSKNCDEYFYIKHRKEARGVGGIFYDYLNTDNFDFDFDFTKEVGLAFHKSYYDIVSNKMFLDWSQDQKKAQLIKRSRYAEFNLLYDRGTRFGLMTNGNIEAIFMSMPPMVIWD